MDIQKQLDQWLASNPTAQQFVTKLWYIREGQPVPADVTHTLRLQSTSSLERHLLIGLVVKPQYAALVDMLLAIIGTQPR